MTSLLTYSLPRAASVLAALLALTAFDSASAGSGSKSQIAIHEHGKNDITNIGEAIYGRFTIEVQGTPFGPAGTTRIIPDPGSTTQLNGQTRIVFNANDTLTSAKGRIVLAITGTHIDVNGKLTSSGFLVGPAVEYGTWKIKAATGIYHGWKGGGIWASATYGYTQPEPYNVEWDGYITR